MAYLISQELAQLPLNQELEDPFQHEASCVEHAPQTNYISPAYMPGCHLQSNSGMQNGRARCSLPPPLPPGSCYTSNRQISAS